MLNDREIAACAQNGMINPFVGSKIRDDRKPSYGLSSYGYDVRLAPSFLVSVPQNPDWNRILDPANTEKNHWMFVPHTRTDYYDIEPGEFVLATTMEYLSMPDDTLALCVGKSTYARCGIIVNTTPIEPGWKGHVTIEISNTAHVPVRLYVGSGIAQLIFFQGNPCLNPYGAGRYQNQIAAPVLP